MSWLCNVLGEAVSSVGGWSALWDFFLGHFLDHKVQLLFWQLLTSPDPSGVCFPFHCSPLPISSHFPVIRRKPLGKATPSFRKKTFALGSHLNLSHSLLFGAYNFSWVSSMQAFSHVVLAYSRSLRNKKVHPLLHKASLQVKWDDYKNIMRLSLLILLLTAVSNTVKHGAEVSEVGYFLMALVISRKGTQMFKTMKARDLMRNFPILSVTCVYHFSWFAILRKQWRK